MPWSVAWFGTLSTESIVQDDQYVLDGGQNQQFEFHEDTVLI